jgi:hypothetical protein
MDAGDWTYVGLAINPVGGLLVAIPWGVLERGYSWPVLLLSGPALGYVQVVLVDVAGAQLDRLRWWRGLLDRRSAKVDRLLRSGGAFFPVFVLTPLLGPWFIMAAMRYAGVPQRRIAAPVLASLSVLTLLLVVACIAVPQWFDSLR